jgi:GTP diphosphokinase / guanosine-3',5'-bis(diphosphate) 3'-diphosphatase
MDVQDAIAQLVAVTASTLGEEAGRDVAAAADLAVDCHDGQLRRLDETPYVTHPIAVARSCFDWGLVDRTAVMAALLHDAVEDAPAHKQAPRRIRALDRDVASLVKALSKIRDPSTGSGDMPATYQRILKAASRDLRVLLIKALDVLHNSRTFQVHRPAKARIKARIGMIYVGVTRRLGAMALADQLVEQCLPHLMPRQAQEASDTLSKLLDQTSPAVAALACELGEFEHLGMVSARVEARRLGQYVILTGTPGKARLDEVGWPVHRLRCQVRDDAAAWRVLGQVHRRFQVMPRYMRDYLNAPRINGFRALTTRVLYEGTPLAVLVEREQDHGSNRSGILAEWGVSGPDRELYKEVLATIGDNDLRMSEVHAHVAQGRIDVFTPRGDRRNLPARSIAVDLAYLIHTELGDHCVGALVNGVRQSPKAPLRDGDVVEIITHPDARPRRTWPALVQTPRAQARLRKLLRREGGRVRGVERDGQGERRFVLHDPTVTSIAWSSCCLPMPPHPILGRVSGKGMWIVHRSGCPHATSERWDTGTWGRLPQGLVLAVTLHLRHRPGALAEVLDVTTRSKVNILSIHSRPRPSGPFLLEVEFTGRTPDRLGALLVELARLEAVRSIRRYSWTPRDGGR